MGDNESLLGQSKKDTPSSQLRLVSAVAVAAFVGAVVGLVVVGALYSSIKSDKDALERKVAAYERLCGPDGCNPASVVGVNATASCRVAPPPGGLPTPATVAASVRAAWAASAVRSARMAAADAAARAAAPPDADAAAVHAAAAAAARAAAALEPRGVAALPSWLNTSAILAIRGGVSETLGFSDTDADFIQESTFFYLTGLDVPDLSLLGVPSAAVPGTIDYTLVVPKQSASYAVWNGYVLTLAEWAALSGIADVIYDVDLTARLGALTKPAGPASVVYTLPGTNPPFVLPGTSTAAVVSDAHLLLASLNAARTSKTDDEVAVLARASRVSAEAHTELMAGIQPGWYEYDAEAVFRLTNALCGNPVMSYLPIVGAGANGAILHYIANDAETTAADILLIDAAANAQRYTSDITRSYPVSGTFTAAQRVIYDAVYAAQTAAVATLAVGSTYGTANAAAKDAMIDHMLAAGIFVGDKTAVVASNVIGQFYMHGLGHPVGLDVHDPAIGAIPPNYVGTIEPGFYFNAALLVPALANPAFAPYLNATAVNAYLDAGFGGVRIEDVYLVRSSGVVNLSEAAPRNITEIEAVMRTDSWFPMRRAA